MEASEPECSRKSVLTKFTEYVTHCPTPIRLSYTRRFDEGIWDLLYDPSTDTHSITQAVRVQSLDFDWPLILSSFIVEDEKCTLMRLPGESVFVRDHSVLMDVVCERWGCISIRFSLHQFRDVLDGYLTWALIRRSLAQKPGIGPEVIELIDTFI